ncbi:MAG: EAL domain-containing protein [Holosporales bacterium]
MKRLRLPDQGAFIIAMVLVAAVFCTALLFDLSSFIKSFVLFGLWLATVSLGALALSLLKERRLIRSIMVALTEENQTLQAALRQVRTQENHAPLKKRRYDLSGPMEQAVFSRFDSSDQDAFDNDASFTEEPQPDEIQRSLVGERVALLLQPIVNLPQKRPRFFEVYGRLVLSDGRLLEPDDFLSRLKESGQIPRMDQILLLQCLRFVECLAPQYPSVRFFVNVSPDSLNDRVFLGQLQDLFQTHGQILPCIVLEISAHAYPCLTDRARKTLELFARKGLRISIDQIEGFDDRADFLRCPAVRFLKVDIRHVVQEVQSAPRARHLYDFRLAAARLEKDIILTHVEREVDLEALQNFRFDYAQGYLMGAPAHYDVKSKKK